MEIFLGVIFWILRIVLVILIALILILLLVLFVPVRYSAALTTADGLCIKAKASWLLKFIRFSLLYKDKTTAKELKIAFFTVFGGKKESTASQNEFDDSYGFQETAFHESVSEEASDKPNASAAEEQPSARVMKKHAKQAVRAEKKRRKKGEPEGDIFAEEIYTVPFFEKIRRFFKDLREKISFAVEAKRAFDEVKTYIFSIVKHILPRKIEGNVDFGFEDPSLTGSACAIIGMLYPALPEKLDLEPDFTGKTFAADVRISGRLILFVLLVNFLRIYFNKKVRALLASDPKKKTSGGSRDTNPAYT